MIAPSISDAYVLIGDSIKTIATVFFDDTIGTGKSSFDSSFCLCGARTYSIQSITILSASSALIASEISIDATTGVITAQTARVLTTGTHTITVKSQLTRSGLTTVTTTSSFVIEVRCVLSSLTMATEGNKYYEVLTTFDNLLSP